MEYTRLTDRAERLWKWKGLNRTIPFETVSPILNRLDQDDYLDQDPQQAIESLSSHLSREGVVESNSLVTAAFLLHLMASASDRYSMKFPIYDRRVWNAYIYLWRIRDKGEQLYRGASQSPARYAMFCRKFRRTCPEGMARNYERALFMFGGFIMDIPPEDSPTPITKIDEVLESQEDSLTSKQRMSGYALVDIDTILHSDQ